MLKNAIQGLVTVILIMGLVVPPTGKPFVGWPPDHAGCYDDDDQDSIPDLAERWELGLNMNRESTDWDKFDDGSEDGGDKYECSGHGDME